MLLRIVRTPTVTGFERLEQVDISSRTVARVFRCFKPVRDAEAKGGRAVLITGAALCRKHHSPKDR